VPIVNNEAARRKPQMSTIHSNCAQLGIRSAVDDGTARCSTVRSGE
jgi:hypothetical protein